MEMAVYTYTRDLVAPTAGQRHTLHAGILRMETAQSQHLAVNPMSVHLHRDVRDVHSITALKNRGNLSSGVNPSFLEGDVY